MATKKQWADAPFDLISSSKCPMTDGKVKDVHLMVAEMIVVHNMFLRGMNSIYLQCVNVQSQPADVVSDFVGYCLVWASALEEHHDGEELIIFPAIEEACGVPGLMAGSQEQHRAFHAGLESYTAYLKAVEAGTEKYDGARLRAVVDGFMPVLTQHLHEEIDSLLALEQYEGKLDWAKWFKDVLDAIVKRSTSQPDAKTKGFPFAIQNHDGSFNETGSLKPWPPLPWPLLVLFRWLFIPKFKGMWRFAPCDDRSRPRELPYASAPGAI